MDCEINLSLGAETLKQGSSKKGSSKKGRERNEKEGQAIV
jgi:hypothetical protein